MPSQLNARTDLTFVASRRAPVPVQDWLSGPSGRPSRLREQHRGVLIELGSSWRPGDATLLLAGLRRAIELDAPLTLCHRGAGGASLLRAAAAELAGLKVRERLRGDAEQLYKLPAPRWRRYPLPARDGDPRPRPVAITGGLGGIGLRLAGQLAGLGHPLWLIDRRPVSALPVVAQQLLARLATATRLVVSQADVTGELPEPPLRIRHLVHAAGELRLAGVRELVADELERQAMVKAAGLRRCVEALAPRGLRSVLAFGSVESRRPHRGFGAYALANELLRLEAGRLRARYPRLQLVTAEWSLWSGVGMAAESAWLAGLAGYAVVSPAWGEQASRALLVPDGSQPAEIVLGGPQSDADQPVRAIAGVGGSSHGLDARSAGRLVALCRTGRVTREQAGPAGVGRPSGQPPAGSVLRAVVSGRRVGTWTTEPQSWDRAPAGGRRQLDGAR